MSSLLAAYRFLGLHTLLRCMSTPPSFFAIFTKGNNLLDLLFASVVNETFTKIGSTLEEKSLLSISRLKKGQNESDRLL